MSDPSGRRGGIVLLAAIAYDPFWQRIDDFQAIIAGSMAIAAAVLTAGAVWRAAKLPVDAETARVADLRRRQLLFARATLDSECQALTARTRQVDATITVVVAANSIVNDTIRANCYLPRHKIIDDWSSMSLFTAETLLLINQLYALVGDHNFDMGRTGGAFGDKNFQRSLRTRLDGIRSLCTRLRSDMSRQS